MHINIYKQKKYRDHYWSYKVFLVFQVVKISHSISSPLKTGKHQRPRRIQWHRCVRGVPDQHLLAAGRPGWHPSDHGNFQRNPSHPQKISPGLYFSGPITYYKGLGFIIPSLQVGNPQILMIFFPLQAIQA